MLRAIRRTLLIWLIVAALVVYIGGRVAATLISASRLEDRSGIATGDILIVTVLLSLLLIALFLRWTVRRSRLTAESVREHFPDAVVLPGVLRAEDRSVMQQVASPVAGVYRPPQYATVVLEADSVSWWVGWRRRPKLAGRASVLTGRYRVGTITHGIGVFPALIAVCAAESGEVELPVLPMRERSVFPRQLEPSVLEGITLQLNGAAAQDRVASEP